MLDKLMKTGAEEIEKAAIAREIATNSGLSDKGVHMDYFDRGVGGLRRWLLYILCYDPLH